MMNQKNKNLLLVDCDTDVLNYLESILKKQYTIFTAENTKDALMALSEEDIDLVAGGIMMPGKGILGLCKSIKNNIDTCHIPVLVLTAQNSLEDRIRSYDAGADGYIEKPFEVGLLKSRIKNLIANSRRRQLLCESNSYADVNISTREYPSWEKEFLSNAVSIVESHLDDTAFDLIVFAEKMNMSRTSLYRKIKTLTNLSPKDFIRDIKLKHACEILKDRSILISEVAYTVGFSNSRNFTKLFKSTFGKTPSEYQKVLVNNI